MTCDIHKSPEGESDAWSVEMIEQGTTAFYEMKDLKEELEKILTTLMSGDTTPAYIALKFLEVRADKEQKMVTAVFALNLREYLNKLKDQNLERRAVGVFRICRIIRVILHEAEKRSPHEVSVLVSKALEQPFLQMTRRFFLTQVA